MANVPSLVQSNLGIVQAAYDRMMYKPLRASLIFDQFATVKPTRQSMPGSSVIFNIKQELNVASTALNESEDVDPVAFGDDSVTVTLAEYGNAVIRTRWLTETGYVAIDPEVAESIGWNAGLSLDTIVRDVLKAGSNVRYATGDVGGDTPTSRETVEPNDTLTANDVRRARTDLVGASVNPFSGGWYVAVIHPDVAYDLKRETGEAAWIAPHVYSEPAVLWTGELGRFSGFRFIENPRAPVFADAGSSTTLTDVYATLFMGAECLAKAHSHGVGPMPSTVVTPEVDTLKRFAGYGWYWLGGYARFREAALRRVDSASSVGSN